MEGLATSAVHRWDLTSPVTTEAYVLQHLPATGGAVMQTVSVCSGFVTWNHCVSMFTLKRALHLTGQQKDVRAIPYGDRGPGETGCQHPTGCHPQCGCWTCGSLCLAADLQCSAQG